MSGKTLTRADWAGRGVSEVWFASPNESAEAAAISCVADTSWRSLERGDTV